MAPALTRPTAEIAALRRLAAVYRRLLLLAVPAALAGCQDAGDSLGPADPAVPPVELVALSTPRIAFTSARSGGGDIYLTDPTGTQPARAVGTARRRRRRYTAARRLRAAISAVGRVSAGAIGISWDRGPGCGELG